MVTLLIHVVMQYSFPKVVAEIGFTVYGRCYVSHHQGHCGNVSSGFHPYHWARETSCNTYILLVWICAKLAQKQHGDEEISHSSISMKNISVLQLFSR